MVTNDNVSQSYYFLDIVVFLLLLCSQMDILIHHIWVHFSKSTLFMYITIHIVVPHVGLAIFNALFGIKLVYPKSYRCKVF